MFLIKIIRNWRKNIVGIYVWFKFDPEKGNFVIQRKISVKIATLSTKYVFRALPENKNSFHCQLMSAQTKSGLKFDCLIAQFSNTDTHTLLLNLD